ncbi:primase-like DNA-binding domain-containing protein [Rhodomicrobium udaipurense]
MLRRTVPAAKDAPEGDSVSRFYRERCAPSLGSRISAQSLHAAYRAWCKARGLAPASMTWFGRSLPEYARRLKTGGRIVYLDMWRSPTLYSPRLRPPRRPCGLSCPCQHTRAQATPPSARHRQASGYRPGPWQERDEGQRRAMEGPTRGPVNGVCERP